MERTEPQVRELAIPFFLRSRWALLGTMFVALVIPLGLLTAAVIAQMQFSMTDPDAIATVRRVMLLTSLACFCVMMALGVWTLNILHRYHAALRDQLIQLREAERAIVESEKELRRSNAELEQFAYVASHDLQEPLRMVASYTQLLSRRYSGKLGPEADEFIHFAVDGARRMQNLINDLLAYSRVGTRGKPFEPAETEKLVRIAMTNLKLAIEEAGAQIETDDLPTVTADGAQLIQLFQNLLANAIKFRKPDEPPRVRISAVRDEDHKQWKFSVNDNGIGIEPEHFDRIFIIFQRLHTREQYEGTGIGLAMCRKIVERHGGKMWVESEPGKGSTFFFTIPDVEKTEENENSRGDAEVAKEDAEKN